jgi:indoleamine 2,3-dioxygenase
LLVLSYLGHAYVLGEEPVATRLPAVIAIPWHAIAASLGRHPILSYATHILNNWRRLNVEQPIALDNLTRPLHFLGGMDEEWFGMIHIVIEAQAAPGLNAMLEAQDAVVSGDVDRVTHCLDVVTTSIEAMLAVLNRMPERCDPYIYYHRVRPFLSGWLDNPAFPDGLAYEGVVAYGGQPQRFRGGSGAQSAIIPSIDDALGIIFDDNPFGIYMRSLREYMPAQHRAFLSMMRERPSIRAFVQCHAGSEPRLVTAYDRCLDALCIFRREHLIFAARYIQAQTPQSAANPNAIGTGGTPFMRYLKQHVEEVRRHRIGHTLIAGS